MHSGNTAAATAATTAAATLAKCARQPACRRRPSRLKKWTPRENIPLSHPAASSHFMINTALPRRQQLGNANRSSEHNSARARHCSPPHSIAAVPAALRSGAVGIYDRDCAAATVANVGRLKSSRVGSWRAFGSSTRGTVGKSGVVWSRGGIASDWVGAGGGGTGARGMSSFLADALRETATNHGIDKICNGSSTCVNDPTVDVQDFVYDVDFRQRPSLRYQPSANAPDPFELVAGDLGGLSDGIKSLIGTDHPVLNAAAKYFFELDSGKKIRPTMVILMSHACNSHAKQLRPPGSPEDEEGHEALQLRLAEITEMIHAASLFHDDVIDEADTRRGVSSVNKVFGNKLAILAGDFLLARSSMSLARLRSLESVELMSAAIEHLVKGEVLQMRPTEQGGGAFEYYVRKNFYKTGSLMANSCKAAAVLGDHHVEVQNVAFEYGKRVGLAFQLVDDILDFEGNAFTLGKPALNDLRQGLATAPVLLAAEQQRGLDKLIKRKFRGPGDVDEALALVHASDGIARARDVAVVQAEKAMDAVLTLQQSPARDALVQLAHKIVNRNH